MVDLNKDAKLDVVTANLNSDTVSTLLGNGDGTLQSATHSTVGNGPWSVVAADLNGDEALDLVTANTYFPDSVSVLLGNGNGTFEAAQTLTDDYSNPTCVEVADLDGDGVLDLITTNMGSANVSVRMGIGNGTFQSATLFTVGSGPRSVIATDLNGDKILDLVTGNEYSDNVSVLLGYGNGGFQAANHFAAGDGPMSVTATDLNSDGHLDLGVTNYYAASASVMLGQGNGNFQLAKSLAVGDGPASVVAADMNQDGIIDLVTANALSDNISVLLGKGYVTFGPETTTTVDAKMVQPLAFGGLQSVTASPDGNVVYAVNPESNALVALAVDEQGVLSIKESYVDDRLCESGAVDGLQGASQVVLNPMHDQLYVLSPDEPALAIFDRNSFDGKLSFREKATVDTDANGVAVSPDDGNTVYVSSSAGLAVWTRQGDGSLTERIGPFGHAGDWIIRATASSGTGALLFVTSDSDDTVRIYEDTGSTIDFQQDITGIVDPSDVALSPDGQHLFVTSRDDSLHVLVRQTDGTYSPLQTFREGEAGLRGMKGAEWRGRLRVRRVCLRDGRTERRAGRLPPEQGQR